MVERNDTALPFPHLPSFPQGLQALAQAAASSAIAPTDATSAVLGPASWITIVERDERRVIVRTIRGKNDAVHRGCNAKRGAAPPAVSVISRKNPVIAVLECCQSDLQSIGILENDALVPLAEIDPMESRGLGVALDDVKKACLLGL